MEINSYAKINLFLDIEGKRIDGYHNIKTVMQEIKLHDTIIIEESHDDILTCSNSIIPTDTSNTCCKALVLIREEYKIKQKVKIFINKQIPSEAGMAGGSSNAAAVIKGLNKLWSLNMSEEKMCQIGAQIGADVPFCIVGGTCLCEGIGERITRLTPFICDNILIIKPDFSISTLEAYRNVKPENYNTYTDNRIIEFIKESDFYKTCKSIANTLEDVVSNQFIQIGQIKEEIMKCGAISSLMTGSGSAIYGLFDDSSTAYNAYCILKNKYKSTFLTSTVFQNYK